MIAALSNATRYTQDWVLDVIIQPLHTTKLCSIKDVLEVASKEYIPYHTFPKISDSICWYKDYDPRLYTVTLKKNTIKTACIISQIDHHHLQMY